MKAPTTSGQPPVDLAAEVQSLRRTLRDVVALAALPSIWVDCDLPRSVQNLTDVLRAALRALTVCVRVELPGGSEFRTAASDRLSNSPAHQLDTAEVLDVIDADSTVLVEIPSFNGSGPLHALPHPLFFDGRQIGCFAACYKSDVLPSQSDRLLLQVAANQITLLFQRHKDQEERVARKLAEERLRHAEHHYQQLVHALPAAVYTCDHDGRITLYNEAAAKLWGRQPKLGADLWCGSWRILKPDGSPLPLNECPMAIAIREGRAVRGQEIIVQRPDGTQISVLVNIDPILDAHGRPAGAINVFQDVTLLKRAEQELRRTTNQLTTFLETAAVGLHRVGPDGIIQWANDAELQMLGYSPEEYIGHDISEFHADAPVISDILKRLTCGEKLYGCEARLKCKDGSIKDVLIDSSVLWEDGRFIHTQCFTRDITEKKRIEEALYLSSRLPAENPAPVLRVDRNYILHFANPKAQEVLSAWKSAVGEPAPPPVLPLLGRGDRHDSEVTVGDRIYSVAVVPVLEGQFINLYFSDVTDRKKAEEALRLSEERFRLATRAGSVGVWDWNVVSNQVTWSDSIYEIHGLKPDEFAGNVEAFAALVHPDDRSRVQRAVERALRGEAPYDIEFRSIRSDGKLIWIYTTAQIVRDQAGAPLRMLGSTVDITRRKEAEKALEQRTRVLEVIHRTGATLAAELDLEKLVQAVTDAGREICGAQFGAFFYNLKNDNGESYTLYTLSGAPRDAFSKYSMPRNTALFAPTFEGSGVIRLDDVLQDPRYGKNAPYYGMPKGHLPVRSYLAVPVMSRSAEALGGLFYGHPSPGVFTEEAEKIITAIAAQAAVAIDNAQLYRAAQLELAERKRAETALRKRSERLQLLSETLGQLLGARDPDTIMRELFPKVALHLGIDTYFNFMVNREGTALKLHSCAGIPEEAARGIEQIEFGQAICGTVAQTRAPIYATDIQNSNYDKAALARGFGIQCYACNPLMAGDRLLGTLSFASRTRKEFDEDELQFLSIASQHTAVALDRLRSAETLRQSEERYRATFENAPVGIAHIGLDGRWLRFNDAVCAITGYARVELERMTFTDITHPHDMAADRQQARQVIAGETSRYAFEKRCVRKDGSIVWVMLTVSLMRDAAGQPLHLVSVIENIDDRKRASDILERTVAERTASLREALEQMEEFSYSVSHDLRGPLRAMNAYAGVLLEDYSERLDETARSYLEKIQRSSDRMNRLTQDVLAYSRVARSQVHPEAVDLEQLIRDILHQYTNLHPPAAEVELIAPLPKVLGHETTLGQSVSNLLNNAVKFVPAGVKPHVRIRAERSGRNVRVWFEDNGIGIKPEHQRRIFNMFERVHPEGNYEGTGIGLTIVRKAMEKMGGKVGVESDGQHGSRFWIELRSAE